MLLRDLSLFLNLEDYGSRYSSDFQFRSRYLCNFLRRRVATLRFKAEGFGSIVVEGCRATLDTCPSKGVGAVSATVDFNKERYESLQPAECHEFFIEMLVAGLEKCARFHHIPLAEFQTAIEEFRAGGYRNNWTFKKKRFRELGLEASLNCSMDMERFALGLTVRRSEMIVFDAPILETKPDETIFSHRFKDMVTENRALIVKDKFGKTTFSLDLDTVV